MEAGWDGPRQRIGPTAACHENEIADPTRSNRPLGHHDRQAGRNRSHFGKRSDVGAGRGAVRYCHWATFLPINGISTTGFSSTSRGIRFGAIASALDAARGRTVSTALGGMLSEYIRLLERQLPGLTDEDAQRSAASCCRDGCRMPGTVSGPHHDCTRANQRHPQGQGATLYPAQFAFASSGGEHVVP